MLWCCIEAAVCVQCVPGMETGCSDVCTVGWPLLPCQCCADHRPEHSSNGHTVLPTDSWGSFSTTHDSWPTKHNYVGNNTLSLFLAEFMSRSETGWKFYLMTVIQNWMFCKWTLSGLSIWTSLLTTSLWNFKIGAEEKGQTNCEQNIVF